MPARPDDLNHEALQAAMTSLFDKEGFDSLDFTIYRDKELAPAIKRMSVSLSPTAKLLRSIADTTCIHREQDICFTADYKTNSGEKSNWVIELEPLFHHLNEAKSGTQMMYVYKDCRANAADKVGEVKAIWAKDVPALITAIHIDNSPTRNRNYRLAMKVSEVVPEFYGFTEGKDAFVVIPNIVLHSLPTPQQLIDELVKGYRDPAI
ncbi:MAG: hypothetical protein EOP06_00380 [Proteobacteria bacterium]|nr:MAG: hypothetical protein EOP06_00380 [Pseudomonadota bacterium]